MQFWQVREDDNDSLPSKDLKRTNNPIIAMKSR